MPRAKLIKRRERAKLIRAAPPLHYDQRPDYIACVFKFAHGDRVRIKSPLDKTYKTGTVSSRVPCDPEVMYYIQVPGKVAAELVSESDIQRRTL